ncbi:hypothetical protein N7462_010236 [Penicillium macrosclerotiorum]|uniref:uncharacterized protein n=1 Tax=Penicillium macrosclerotiorum TaxID=303699 RepID=UPI002548AE2D|nr:uncharacterized protein N7462_010236 [Penicillium macrosclerotiorum]KAJ5669166.1 hypothetical protein N7462_010236 [Penicillium macrosclerotiorum]
MNSLLSDLVLDSRIQVEFSDNFTYRFTFQSRVSSAPYFRRKLRKDTWQTVKLLGSGSYGNVSLHRCLTSEGKAELQAVKEIKKAIVSEGIDYYRELEAIAKFSQKKYEGLFVDFIGWYENDISVFIIMEYMEYGDLDLHLKGPLPENEAREVTLQIAEGLKLLHENGFAHRDLKPANIFVFHKGPDWWVKIGDFGFSKRVNEKDGLRSCVGTPVFLAPEVQMLYSPSINNQNDVLHYTEKVDIWALGAITFYMIFHDYPFSPWKSITLHQYMQGEAFPFPKSRPSEISKACKSFIKATMAPDASQRLSAKQATENEWLMLADFQLAKTASVKIKKENLSDSISTERLQEVLEPMQKCTSDGSNNDNISAGGNIRKHILPNNPESSAKTAETARSAGAYAEMHFRWLQ